MEEAEGQRLERKTDSFLKLINDINTSEWKCSHIFTRQMFTPETIYDPSYRPEFHYEFGKRKLTSVYITCIS